MKTETSWDCSKRLGHAICWFVAAILMIGCSGTNTNRSSTNQPAAAEASKGSTNPETVSLDAPDGLKLAGSLWKSPKPDSPGVLLLHQWQSDRHSFDDFATKLNAEGFNVLAVDGRGFGESTKKSDGSSVSSERSDAAVKAMLADVEAAYGFLSKQKNVDPSRVGIVGASYGSSLAIMFGAGNAKVAAVALLSPGLNYFGNMQTEPAVKSFRDRPLLMAAANDDPDSANTVSELGKSGSENQKMKVSVLQKGGHGTALLKDSNFENSLVSFLVESLQHPN